MYYECPACAGATMCCAAHPTTEHYYSTNSSEFLAAGVVLCTMELLRGEPSHITSVCYILLYLYLYIVYGLAANLARV